MVSLNYTHRKTVKFAVQVRVAQIDRIEAQLPRSIALIDRHALITSTFWHDLQALPRAVKTLSASIEHQPIELVAVESKMQLQLCRRHNNKLKLAIDRLLMYSRSVEWKLAPNA